MRSVFVATLACLCLALPAHAAEPSPASIELLLVVSNAQKNNEAVLVQVNSMLKPMFQQALGAREMTAEQRQQAEAFMDEFSRRMAPVMQDELAWERMKGPMAQVYAESFTQEEIDGLIAFYESPAGRAFVEKMPIVMQKSMLSMQQRMGPLVQRMTQAATEAVNELKDRQTTAANP